MLSDLSDFLIEPNSEKESLYCRKYSLELKRLENGIIILGIPCKKDSTSFAHIKYDFSEGAYGNEAGGAHFLEHFINKRARRIAERNSLNINAHTSQIEFEEEVLGIANPSVTDYGMWPVLQEIRNALESPLNTVEDLEKTIKTEKNVIEAEIKRIRVQHDFQVGNHFRD